MMIRELTRIFKSYLDENRFWSYRETLFEAIAVLWISTSISAELVKRYFPDWRASRIDPEAESLGFLWRMLGYGEEDRCIWDRALSFWKISNISVCQNDSDTFPVLTDMIITIGYVGTYAMLTATVLLYLLFFYSLFVNKSVRHPVRMLTIPAFHHIEKLFKIYGHKPGHCTGLDPEPGVKRCTEDCNVQPETSKCSCRDLGRCLLILVLCILILIPAMVIGFLGTVLIILWTVFLLLPVVVLATGVARTASGILGEDAIFPCYVLLALALIVYSAGRMLGLWMRSSYLLWICNVTQKNKTISNESSINTITSFDTVVEPTSPLAATKLFGYLIAMYAFGLAISAKVEFGNWLRLRPWAYGSYGINATSGNDSDFNATVITKKLRYWSALDSYWVSNSTTYDYTILPEPSSLAQTIGSFCDILIEVPVYLLMTYQILGLLLFLIHSHVVGSLRKRHDSNPTDKRYPKWYTYLYDYRPTLAKCWCGETLMLVLAETIIEIPLFAMLVLPFPILNAFIPEQYHLPGLAVMITACAVGALYTTVQFIRAHWREYKRYPYDPLGEKLSCRKHPLCGNYRTKAGKRECASAEEGTPVEEESILEVAMEETVDERSA